MNFRASEDVQETYPEWVEIVRTVAEKVDAVDQAFVSEREARLQFDAAEYDTRDLHHTLTDAFEDESRETDEILVSGGSFAYIGDIKGADHEMTKEIRVSNFSVLEDDSVE